MEGNSVYIYIYDLSGGLAATMSKQLIGTYYEAVYHSAVVVHGKEFYYGGNGICAMQPGCTHFGNPIRKDLVGHTGLSCPEVLALVESLQPHFGPDTYQFFSHNCNHFSDQFIRSLTNGVACAPDHVVNQAAAFANTSMGQMLRPMIEQALEQAAQTDNPLARSLAPGQAPSAAPAPAGLPDDDEGEIIDGRAFFFFPDINGERTLARLSPLAGERTETLAAFLRSPADASLPALREALRVLDDIAGTATGADLFAVFDAVRAAAARPTGVALLLGAGNVKFPALSIEAAFERVATASGPTQALTTMVARYAANLSRQQGGRKRLWLLREQVIGMAERWVEKLESSPRTMVVALLGMCVNLCQSASETPVWTADEQAVLHKLGEFGLTLKPTAASILLSML